MPGRRDLAFDRLEDVPAEVDRLLIGHRTVGGWTLAQICTHLAAAIRLSADPAMAAADADRSVPPDQERARTIARRLLFRSGRFPEGIELPTPAIAPGPADADPGPAAEALRSAVASLLDATGPFPPHPMIGPLDRDQWRRFHCLHCAHHLSFVLPITPAGGGDRPDPAG